VKDYPDKELSEICHIYEISLVVRYKRDLTLKEYVATTTMADQHSVAYMPSNNVCLIIKLPSAAHFLPPLLGAPVFGANRTAAKALVEISLLPQAPLILTSGIKMRSVISPIHANVVYTWDTRVAAALISINPESATVVVVPFSTIGGASSSRATTPGCQDTISSSAGG